MDSPGAPTVREELFLDGQISVLTVTSDDELSVTFSVKSSGLVDPDTAQMIVAGYMRTFADNVDRGRRSNG